MEAGQMRVGQVVRCYGDEDQGNHNGRGRIIQLNHPGLYGGVLVEMFEIDGLDEHPPVDDGGGALCMAYQSSYLSLIEQAPTDWVDPLPSIPIVEIRDPPPLPDGLEHRIPGNIGRTHINAERERALGITADINTEQIVSGRHVDANNAMDLLNDVTNEITEVVDHLGNITRYINGEPEHDLLERLEVFDAGDGHRTPEPLPKGYHQKPRGPTGPVIGRGTRRLKI